MADDARDISRRLAKEQVLFNLLQRNQNITTQPMALFEQYDRFGRPIPMQALSDTLDTIDTDDMTTFAQTVLASPPRLIEINRN